MSPRLAPFSSGTDADTYVPRLALESALAELGEVTDKHPSCAALVGTSGLGKTLLLHVLKRRLEGAYECLYLPSPRLEAAEVWRWAAQALGLGTGEDDRGAVLGRASRLPAEGSGLVLLVDDAAQLPTGTRSDLLDASETLGFTLVLTFDADDVRELQSLPSFVHPVEIGPAMTLAETRAYVHGRLRTLDPDGSISGRLTAERLAGFHEAAAGVPARLNALLDAWLADVGWLSGGDPRPNPYPERPWPSATTSGSEGPTLPAALEPWLERLREPRVQLALGALFFAAILGSWLFAWRLSPGVSSVGVPLEEARVERGATLPAVSAEAPALPSVEPSPPLELAPELPAADVTGDAVEAGAASEPSGEAAELQSTVEGELSAPESAPAPRAARSRPVPSIAPPLPAEPPLRDEALVEAPVEIASNAFPDEHVPQPIQEQPLAAPPAGPRLSVNARPWASIALDGSAVGETPLGELRLTPGAHVVTATFPDGRVIERRVEARAGDVYVVFP